MTRTERESLPQPTSRDILDPQLKLITYESLRADFVGPHDPWHDKQLLQSMQSRQVMAIDIGGTKIFAATHTVDNGQIVQDGVYAELFPNAYGNGKGYVPILEKLSAVADELGVPVGISSAGKYQNGILTRASNLPVFVEELETQYGGDLKNVLPMLRGYGNDTVIGMLAGALDAIEEYPDSENFITMISASGIGTGVSKNGRRFHAEPGHVRAIPALNPHGQEKPCGILGAEYVCLENVASAPAIASTYNKRYGTNLDGIEIGKRYHKEAFVRELYDNSARVIAHAIIGTGDVFHLWDDSKKTSVIYHGGNFNVPGYADRITTMVQHARGDHMSFLLKGFEENRSLKGAAMAALYNT